MRFLFILIFVLMVPVLSFAQTSVTTCPALADVSSYKSNKSLRVLEEGREDWIFRTKADFNDDFKMNEALKQRFARLKHAFEKQNIDLVIALLPTRGMMHAEYAQNFDKSKAVQSYQKLTNDITVLGIPLAAIDDFASGQSFYYKRDHHWNADGARRMAEQVAMQVKAFPVYASLMKKTYQTDPADAVPHKGSFADFVKDTCQIDLPAEQAATYKTYVEGNESGDLFETQVEPEIVLVGTSNSVDKTSHANFSGFLREYIGGDVNNVSVSGGGVDTAMLDWLSSSDYKSAKPKVVIWEIPVYQNFKGAPFYQQAIPAVYGACDNAAVMSDQAVIESNGFTLFEGVDQRKISGKGHYLHLKFSDFNGRKFRLTSEYADGSKDPFDFKRSKFYQPDGVFFLELDQDKAQSLAKVKGLMPEGSSGTVLAQICAY